MLNRRETLTSFRAALQSVGYESRLIAENYDFADFDDRQAVVNRVPLAAFSGYPSSYRNACVGLVFGGEGNQAGALYVHRHRALGAPLIFEVAEEAVQPWRIGPNEARPDGKPFPLATLERTFHSRCGQWSPDAVGRLKMVSAVSPNAQLDFYDTGLMSVLAEFFQTKLKDLLERAFADTAEIYKSVNGSDPAVTDLFPYLFRFVTAKIFMDRADARGWEGLGSPRMIFEKAEAHCGAGLLNILPTGFLKPRVLEKAWNSIEQNFHFQNLSVPDLAFIYESSFINEDTRRQLGIHSTPLGLADYIVENLPWNDVPIDQRHVFEPFCGHGIFLARSMERLGRDLDPTLTAKQRHKYFRDMLVGVEKDPLAIEVCRLVLTLSDYPNDNSWQLHADDVFTWRGWDEALKSATAVVANPPYESFPSEERQRVGATKAQPPAELLHRMMRRPPPMFGLVLPQSFLTSPFYQGANRQIAQRYERVSILKLPKIFRYADNETVAVIASGLRERGRHVTVTYAEVPPGKAEDFLSDFRIIAKRSAKVAVPGDADNFSLWVSPPDSIFERLASLPKLASIATIHKGINWKKRTDQLPRTALRTDVVADTEKEGFHPGAEKMAGNLSQFHLRTLRYLSLRDKDQSPRDCANKHPWDERKVVCNAARFERKSPWRLAAWADSDGLAFTKQYFAIWPKENVSEFALAAVLSSPFASAFSFERDLGIDNHISTLRALPIPTVDQLTPTGELHRCAKRLQQLLARRDFTVSASAEQIVEAVLRLDATILAAYNLPSNIQRQLLAQFQGWRRPLAVPFTGYFPEHFKDAITLKDLVAIQYDWEDINERRCDLIEKEISKRKLSSEEREELDYLQRLADLLVRLKAPYPLDELGSLVDKLKTEGKWRAST